MVAGQTERGGVVQPSFFEGDLASVSSSAVSRWVENESFGLVSDFTAVTFSRCLSRTRHFADPKLVLGVVRGVSAERRVLREGKRFGLESSLYSAVGVTRLGLTDIS